MLDTIQRQALSRKLWASISARGDFPLLSESVRDTISAMKGEDYDFAALVQIVLSDFTLTQRVIRLANSAMYMAFGGNITTVSRALVVLGIEAVGHLVLGLKLVDHFQHSHQNLQRLDAKLELNRAMLAGYVARKVCETRDVLLGEEAVVCSLMRQLGKLLCIFYLENEWVAIREHALATGKSEDRAALDTLGVSFEELGEEVAEHWGLPPVIRQGMAAFDPGREAEPDAPFDRRHWVQAVAAFSVQMSQSMTVAGADVEQRERNIRETAHAYARVLSVNPHLLYEQMDGLTRERASQRFIQQIDELHAESEQGFADDAEQRLREGLQDLRSLPSEQKLGPVLAMASEAIMAGMQFARTIVFVADPRRHCFDAKLGFGQGIEQRLPLLRFHEVFSVDVFHLAITNSVGIFVERARDPNFRAHIPPWFRDAMPDVESFVLLPVHADKDTKALIYGDWNDPARARKISPEEMAVLNDLARELGRFFGRSGAGAGARHV